MVRIRCVKCHFLSFLILFHTAPNANLLHFGEALKEEMRKVEAELPIGVGLHLVSDQPAIVEEAVGGFTKALFEAVAIVLRGPTRSTQRPKTAAEAPRKKMARLKIQASCGWVQSLGADCVMPSAFVRGSLKTLKA